MRIRKALQTLWITLTAAGVCILGSVSHAATQGTTAMGQSTAALDLTVTTGLVARVNGLDDIDLGAWSGTGDMSGSDDLCIGRSGVGFFGQGAYRMRLDGDGDPADINAFTLTNGVDTLYYDVFFNDQTGSAGQIPVTAGVMFSSQQGGGFGQILNVLFGCVVENASVTVQLPEANLLASPMGTYTGTLTLVLIPE